MSGISAPPTPIKFDSAGNVLANLNAQNITPNTVATNVKTDANGNILANINAQSITPTAIASNIKTDANGNVLANLNAQSIQPTIANPYTPQLLSHQTGLSATVSTANTYVNIGSSITLPRAGIVKIIIMGYTSATSSTVSWRLTLTRGGTTYTVTDQSGNSLWGSSTSVYNTFVSHSGLPGYLVIELACLSGDVLQLMGTGNVAGVIVYVTDMVVILE